MLVHSRRVTEYYCNEKNNNLRENNFFSFKILFFIKINRVKIIVILNAFTGSVFRHTYIPINNFEKNSSP